MVGLFRDVGLGPFEESGTPGRLIEESANAQIGHVSNGTDRVIRYELRSQVSSAVAADDSTLREGKGPSRVASTTRSLDGRPGSSCRIREKPMSNIAAAELARRRRP